MSAPFIVSMRVGDHWENYAEYWTVADADAAASWLHLCFPGREITILARRGAFSRDRAA